MSKLLPPYIEGKLPAQAGGELKIPFRLNRSVAIDSIKEKEGFKAKIKSIANNTEIATLSSSDFDLEQVKFVIPNDKEDKNALILKVGQYYKIQLACVDENGVDGYYSSIGVFKFTNVPTVAISCEEKELELSLALQYSNEGDPTEKLSSYQFDIYEEQAGYLYLYESSGELIHNSNTDTEQDSSVDTYIPATPLQYDKTYKIDYKCTTTNGYVIKPDNYITVQKTSSGSNIVNNKLIATNDLENGRIILSLQKAISGGIAVFRSTAENNFTSWRLIDKLDIDSGVALSELAYDYTIEQGKYYKYAIARYSGDSITSARLESEVIYAEYEDMFLYDSERQLRIAFNPKVSSFKTSLLETKTDTLGSKYPFFFRNGYVRYNELSIAGLVSHLTDYDNLFMSQGELLIPGGDQWARPGASEMLGVGRSTDLTSQNYYAEKVFKNKALEWLNNGKPKLFKSPSEGIFIVRLMNVSLSPNDTLGRLVHTFSATAYEVAPMTQASLKEYNLIYSPREDEKVLNYSSFSVAGMSTINGRQKAFDRESEARRIEAHGLSAGTTIAIKYFGDLNEYELNIDSSYQVFKAYDKPFQYIRIVSDYKNTSGYFVVGQYSAGSAYGIALASLDGVETTRSFSYYTDESFEEVLSSNLNTASFTLVSIIGSLTFSKRAVIEIYRWGNKYYYVQGSQESPPSSSDQVTPANSNSMYIYHIYGTDKYYNPKTDKIYDYSPNYKYTIVYGDGKNNSFNLNQSSKSWPIDNTISKVYIGNGVIVSGTCKGVAF